LFVSEHHWLLASVDDGFEWPGISL